MRSKEELLEMFTNKIHPEIEDNRYHEAIILEVLLDIRDLLTVRRKINNKMKEELELNKIHNKE